MRINYQRLEVTEKKFNNKKTAVSAVFRLTSAAPKRNSFAGKTLISQGNIILPWLLVLVFDNLFCCYSISVAHFNLVNAGCQ